MMEDVFFGFFFVFFGPCSLLLDSQRRMLYRFSVSNMMEDDFDGFFAVC